MIQLYGLRMSNYYSLTKALLLEKGLEFEEVKAPPGKVMEFVLHIKLDIELGARRCLPELLFKQPVSDETKEQVKTDLTKGIKAVSRLAACKP